MVVNHERDIAGECAADDNGIFAEVAPAVVLLRGPHREHPVTRLRPLVAFVALSAIAACAAPAADRSTAAAPPASYYDTTGRADVYTCGGRLVAVTTPKGTFHVWTRRVGNNPRIKLLLL